MQKLKKPKIMQDEEQKESKETSEVMSLVRVFFRAIIPMKVAVLYFGSRMSEEPSLENILLFALSIIISFGSLIYYAAKKHREKNSVRPKD